MSAFLNHQLTNVGWDALSTALGGGRLTFFKMQAGSGTIANDAAIPGMTALVAPVYDIAITSYVIEGDGQITLFGNINSELLDTGFTFKELGVFATIEPPILGLGGIPAGTGIQILEQTPSTQATPIIPNPGVGVALMYSYCNSYGASDYIPGKTESTNVVNTVQVTIKIAQADNVVINILPGESGFAVTNIGPPTVGPGVWSYTNANIAYLKRLVQGGGISLSEDANTITIATTTSTLLYDLDLYVANGNPDISPHFSTIQNAISYLGQFLIPATIKARIHVSRGFYAMPGIVGTDQGFQAHTKLDHPQGQAITIQGPQNNTVNGSSVSSITGSSGNWTVTVGGISNTSQFFVNDYLIIHSTGQASNGAHPLIWGFFKVTAKTGSSVSFKVPWDQGSFSLSGTNNIQLTPISVILTPGENVVGFQCGPGGIGLFQYIGVVGQESTKRNAGILTEGGNATFNFCGVAGYNSDLDYPDNDNAECGFATIYGGTCIFKRCAATDNQDGFGCGAGGSIVLIECAASHNGAYGIHADGGGECLIHEGMSATAGNASGIGAIRGCSVTFLLSKPDPGIFCYGNSNIGFDIYINAAVSIFDGGGIVMKDNGSYDVKVLAGGLMFGQAYIGGDRSFNIPVGTISTQGGLIV